MKQLKEKIESDNYELKFDWFYIDCANFKERELLLLRNTIAKARLGHDLSFYKYATITFSQEDIKHETPIINELESFGRGKTNAIIFNMANTNINNNKFNKCLVYQTIYKTDAYYGYIFYHTETQRYIHIYNVNHDICELIIHIGRSIDTLQREEMYNYYLTRYK